MTEVSRAVTMTSTRFAGAMRVTARTRLSPMLLSPLPLIHTSPASVTPAPIAMCLLKDDEDFDFSIEDFGAPDANKKKSSGTAAASYQGGAPFTSDDPMSAQGGGVGSYGSVQ